MAAGDEHAALKTLSELVADERALAALKRQQDLPGQAGARDSIGQPGRPC